jgi:predicted transcriptional regulator
MKLLKHHAHRKAAGITHRGEEVLGALQQEGECKTQHLRNIGMGQDVHDVLAVLMRNGYVQMRKQTQKLFMYSLTDLGREYIQQVEAIYGSR